jgi:hypothetical protein
MIAEYIDDVRKRLNVAVRAGNLPEIARLSQLLSVTMLDGGSSGEKMPWELECPICGTPIPQQA